MTIAFEIPNGSMELVLDEFLSGAKMSQINKAIKLMPNKQKQETAAWLKEQLEWLPAKALSSFMMHREYESRIPEMERIVEMLKHDPQDKEQLREMKMSLSRSRRSSALWRRKSEEMSKLKKRYGELSKKLGGDGQ